MFFVFAVTSNCTSLLPLAQVHGKYNRNTLEPSCFSGVCLHMVAFVISSLHLPFQSTCFLLLLSSVVLRTLNFLARQRTQQQAFSKLFLCYPRASLRHTVSLETSQVASNSSCSALAWPFSALASTLLHSLRVCHPTTHDQQG